MAKVIGLDTASLDNFEGRLNDVWESGDAVFPIDRRLPGAARHALLETIRPTEIWGPGGRETYDGDETDDGDALVMATSGTSGSPKGVVLTHTALDEAARITNEVLSVDPATDKWAVCLPVSHMAGLGALNRARLAATPFTLTERCTAEWINEAGRSGATLISLVPAALGGIDPSLFRVIVLGGSAMPDDRPPNAVATYGMTETAGGIVYNGRPLSGVEIRIVGGIVQLRSPTLLRCYRDGADPKTEEGWLPTGDAGSFDANGRLTIDGRADDVVITGGEKVWPAAVEEVLANHPGVGEVAVVGRPDERWGSAVTAVVVPSDPRHPPQLDQLRGFVKEVLPAYAAPHRVEYVAALSRTPSGKVRRGDL